MKKILFIIFLFFVFLPANNARAAAPTLNLSCPATADVNSSVTCILTGVSGDYPNTDENGVAIPGSYITLPANSVYGCIKTGDNIISQSFTPDQSWPHNNVDSSINATDQFYVYYPVAGVDGKSGPYTVGTITVKMGPLPNVDSTVGAFWRDFMDIDKLHQDHLLVNSGGVSVKPVIIRTNPIAVAPAPAPVVTAPVSTVKKPTATTLAITAPAISNATTPATEVEKTVTTPEPTVVISRETTPKVADLAVKKVTQKASSNILIFIIVGIILLIILIITIIFLIKRHKNKNIPWAVSSTTSDIDVYSQQTDDQQAVISPFQQIVNTKPDSIAASNTDEFPPENIN